MSSSLAGAGAEQLSLERAIEPKEVSSRLVYWDLICPELLKELKYELPTAKSLQQRKNKSLLVLQRIKSDVSTLDAQTLAGPSSGEAALTRPATSIYFKSLVDGIVRDIDFLSELHPYHKLWKFITERHSETIPSMYKRMKQLSDHSAAELKKLESRESKGVHGQATSTITSVCNLARRLWEFHLPPKSKDDSLSGIQPFLMTCLHDRLAEYADTPLSTTSSLRSSSGIHTVSGVLTIARSFRYHHLQLVPQIKDADISSLLYRGLLLAVQLNAFRSNWKTDTGLDEDDLHMFEPDVQEWYQFGKTWQERTAAYLNAAQMSGMKTLPITDAMSAITNEMLKADSKEPYAGPVAAEDYEKFKVTIVAKTKERAEKAAQWQSQVAFRKQEELLRDEEFELRNEAEEEERKRLKKLEQKDKQIIRDQQRKVEKEKKDEQNRLKREQAQERKRLEKEQQENQRRIAKERQELERKKTAEQKALAEKQKQLRREFQLKYPPKTLTRTSSTDHLQRHSGMAKADHTQGGPSPSERTLHALRLASPSGAISRNQDLYLHPASGVVHSTEDVRSHARVMGDVRAIVVDCVSCWGLAGFYSLGQELLVKGHDQEALYWQMSSPLAAGTAGDLRQCLLMQPFYTHQAHPSSAAIFHMLFNILTADSFRSPESKLLEDGIRGLIETSAKVRVPCQPARDLESWARLAHSLVVHLELYAQGSRTWPLAASIVIRCLAEWQRACMLWTQKHSEIQETTKLSQGYLTDAQLKWHTELKKLSDKVFSPGMNMPYSFARVAVAWAKLLRFAAHFIKKPELAPKHVGLEIPSRRTVQVPSIPARKPLPSANAPALKPTAPLFVPGQPSHAAR